MHVPVSPNSRRYPWRAPSGAESIGLHPCLDRPEVALCTRFPVAPLDAYCSRRTRYPVCPNSWPKSSPEYHHEVHQACYILRNQASICDDVICAAICGDADAALINVKKNAERIKVNF